MSPFDPATEGARHTAGELAWARARLRALIDGGVVGVLFGDVDGAIHECNEEFARIVGRPEWELGDGFSWSPENYELFGLDRSTRSRRAGPTCSSATWGSPT